MKQKKEVHPKPAVFLDRDGVLTKEKSYICSLRELELYPFTTACIEEIHNKGYLAIVITNQSGIARGLFTEAELAKMNNYLMEQTGVDAVYYCPHHPNGTIMEYKKNCDCRKPAIGLIERASDDFAIDMTKSYFVGDRATDIETGKNAGIQTVLVNTGYGIQGLEKEVNPNYIVKDLKEFVSKL